MRSADTKIARRPAGAFARRSFLFALGAWPLARAAAPAWPDRPLSLAVPAGAGTGPDITARRIADLVAPQLGQPVIVDNRAGAAGALAAEHALHGGTDGHSLLLGTSATICINPLMPKNAGPDPASAFRPVCMLTRGHPLLVVPADFPASDLAQFVARAKSGARQVTYASAGAGSSSHLAGALLASVTGTPLYHVPYSDEARAIVDVLGGQVDAMITFAAAVAPHVQAGKLKALAIAGPKRSPLLSAVRTSTEQGFPAFDLSGWLGIFVPAGVAAERVAQLEREFIAAARAPAYSGWVASLGSEAVALASADFAAAIQADRAKYAALLRAANLLAGARP
jgi:tripartite-type tricarboxylate transporter receptor subunit TctC